MSFIEKSGGGKKKYIKLSDKIYVCTDTLVENLYR